MILTNEITTQCIVVAGNPPGFTTKIQQVLRDHEFENVIQASNSKKVYETVHSLANFPGRMGLIIIHQRSAGLSG